MPFPKSFRRIGLILRTASLACLAWAACAHAVWTPVPGILPVPDGSWKPGLSRQSPRMIADRDGFLYAAPNDTLLIIGPDGALRKTRPSDDSMPPDRVLATGGGLLVWGKKISLDRGLTWIENPKSTYNPRTLSISRDGWALRGGLNEGMGVSMDSCRTWKSVRFGPSFASINQVAAFPGWALASRERYPLLVSLDRGETWSDLPGTESTVKAGMIAVDPAFRESGAWAVGEKPPALYALRRLGDSIAFFSRAPARGFPDSPATALAVSINPDSGRRLWLGTWGQGIFTSDDSGSTWTARNEGLRDMGVDAIAVTSSGKAWALTRDGLYADLEPAVGIRTRAPADGRMRPSRADALTGRRRDGTLFRADGRRTDAPGPGRKR